MELSGPAWVLLAFLSGSVPYSLLLGRLFLRRDIRAYGDGNPGATNVFRAGGKLSGVLAILLDGFKAAIPVGLAVYAARLPLPWLFVAALAPILGHMFSPFLKGKGGKAVAAAFGMWAGLTFFEAPILLGLFFLVFSRVLKNSGWIVLLSMTGLLAHFLLNRPDPFLIALWFPSTLLLAWKHRHELAKPPGLHSPFPRPV